MRIYGFKLSHIIHGNVRVKVYSPLGREIGSSCGEFTKHYYHQEIETPEQLEEFLTWKKNMKYLSKTINLSEYSQEFSAKFPSGNIFIWQHVLFFVSHSF